MRAGIEALVHRVAEGHVDRSILDSSAFVCNNVLGTQTLLHASHTVGRSPFLHVSCDEVYGSLGADGSFTEGSLLAPNSPYAASKAGTDLLVRAFSSRPKVSSPKGWRYGEWVSGPHILVAPSQERTLCLRSNLMVSIEGDSA